MDGTMRQAYLASMKRHILSMFTAIAIIHGAWADTGADPESATESSLQEVRVQLKWAHQFQFAGYYAAIHNGYYRNAGLDVTLIEYSPGVAPIDQLMGGRVDFAVADTGALLYRAVGVPLVALAAVFQNSPSVLVSRADTGIRELQALKNKRVMLAGGYMNAELMSMLNEAGITGNDINMVPSVTDINALIDGHVDAFNAYTTNELYELTRRNIPFVTFLPSDYGVDFYGDILITTEATIESSPEMVRRFHEATLRGWAYAVEEPEAVVDIILDHYNTQNKSRAHLMFEAEEAIKLILPNVVPIGYMNKERLQRIEEIFREQGFLTQSVDMKSFIYMPEESAMLLDMFNQYRLQIIAGIILVVVLLMLSHIIRLRTQINLRTKELKEAKKRAELEARTDLLTGLPNRRYFLEELARDIAQAERYDIPLSVISVDIDYFKNINDRHGHAAGDEALRCVGKIFRNYTRTGDIAARIGGEEFAVACLNTPREETHKLADRLCKEMKRKIIKYEDESFLITFSMGIAMREKGDNVEQLLKKADLALYDAKQGGRNRICVWDYQFQT
jgi:diguanylate cyclase (GGDEF)-like protein